MLPRISALGLALAATPAFACTPPTLQTQASGGPVTAVSVTSTAFTSPAGSARLVYLIISGDDLGNGLPTVNTITDGLSALTFIRRGTQQSYTAGIAHSIDLFTAPVASGTTLTGDTITANVSVTAKLGMGVVVISGVNATPLDANAALPTTINTNPTGSSTPVLTSPLSTSSPADFILTICRAYAVGTGAQCASVGNPPWIAINAGYAAAGSGSLNDYYHRVTATITGVQQPAGDNSMQWGALGDAIVGDNTACGTPGGYSQVWINE